MELGTSALSLCTALGQNYLRRFPFDEQSQVVNFWYSSSFYTHWLCVLKVLLGPEEGFAMLVLTGFVSSMALRHRIFDMTLPMSTRYIRSGIHTVTQDFLGSLHTPKQNFLHSLRAFCINFRYSGKFQTEFYCGFNFHPP